jgi:hypothetical protein
VFSNGLGRRDGLEASSVDNRQGFLRSDDWSPSLASVTARDIVDEEKESSRCGVRGGEDCPRRETSDA